MTRTHDNVLGLQYAKAGKTLRTTKLALGRAENLLDAKLASSYLGQPNHFVIVNYLRKAIGQEKGGHISPLAAYDGKADRFLILDVARYKYPPVWVKASELFDAMNTQDSDNEDKTRGFVLEYRRLLFNNVRTRRPRSYTA